MSAPPSVTPTEPTEPGAPESQSALMSLFTNARLALLLLLLLRLFRRRPQTFFTEIADAEQGGEPEQDQQHDQRHGQDGTPLVLSGPEPPHVVSAGQSAAVATWMADQGWPLICCG